MQKKISTLTLRDGLLTLVLFLLSFASDAGVCTWTSTGASTNWNSASAWTVVGSGCASVPPTTLGPNDNVNINHTINLTGNLTVGSGGVLVLNSGANLTVTGSVDLQNGSTFDAKQGSTMSVTGNFNNSNNSTGVTVNGAISVGGNFTAGNGSSVGPVDSGTGSISVSGTITTSGSATIFGSTAECTVGPCVTTSVSALPVELLYISANCSEQHVRLNWQTASEFNSSHYILKRSKDGIEWEEIGRVNAAGYSVEVLDYEFVDLVPYSNTSYYKVFQYDNNGEYVEYSIMSVQCEQDEKRIVIYPNPSEKEFHVQFNNEQMGEVVKLIITDARGIVVFGQEVFVEKGANDLLFSDLKLVPGFYNVQILDGSHFTQSVLFMR